MKRIIVLLILLTASSAMALEVKISGNVITLTATSNEMTAYRKEEGIKSLENIIKEAVLDTFRDRAVARVGVIKAGMKDSEVEAFCKTKTCGTLDN